MATEGVRMRYTVRKLEGIAQRITTSFDVKARTAVRLVVFMLLMADLKDQRTSSSTTVCYLVLDEYGNDGRDRDVLFALLDVSSLSC